jgi:hypothetical protein
MGKASEVAFFLHVGHALETGIVCYETNYDLAVNITDLPDFLL